jgi:hypothetical protein
MSDAKIWKVLANTSTVSATPMTFVFKSRKGFDRGCRRADFGDEGRARVDAGVPPESTGAFHAAPHARLGRRSQHAEPGRIFTSTPNLRKKKAVPGMMSRIRSKKTFDRWVSPKPSRSSWQVWAPSTNPRWCTTISRSTWRESRASSSRALKTACASTPICSGVFRQSHPD